MRTHGFPQCFQSLPPARLGITVRPLILVTNDDGIRAPGLASLVQWLEPLGDVWVYAPDRQQSAVGHGVSLHRPLRVYPVQDKWFMVDGTPTDCVMLAVRDLMKVRPNLVVSGINTGANLGDDVTYSGTVAGAFEGKKLGLCTFAISKVSYTPRHIETAGRVAQSVAKTLIANHLPADSMLNVNVPDVPYEELRGVRVTRMGRRTYQDEIIHRQDPRSGTYYWIGGAEPSHVSEPETDFDAIEKNEVSVTPLHRDMTDHAMLGTLKTWEFKP